MIDWFVLLAAAIALVPIVLLFAFVGCVLDREGTLPPPINFTYQKGLDEIDTIVVGFTFLLDSAGDTVESRTINDVKTEGETIEFKGAPLDSSGTIVCTCNLTTKTGPSFDDQAVSFSATKTATKEEDELVGDFKLSRNGMGGFVVL